MKQYESAALALSSRHVYQVGLRHYRHFCKNSGLKAYPVSQDTLKFFINFLAEQMNFKTLKLYLAAVKLNNIELGYKDNMHKMAQLHLLLRDIKRTLGNKGKRKQCLPVTLPLLRSLKQYLEMLSIPNQDKLMPWVAFTTAFFSFLRSSESVSPSPVAYDESSTLLVQDITLQGDAALISIKASKTDPFREGVTLYLAAIGRSVCPVRALRNYLPYCRRRSQPLFRFKNGHFLTMSTVSRVIKKGLVQAGVAPDSYSSYSFRIGSASTAAKAGLPDSLIKSLGCWRSDCFQRYVRISLNCLQKVHGQLVDPEAVFVDC